MCVWDALIVVDALAAFTPATGQMLMPTCTASVSQTLCTSEIGNENNEPHYNKFMKKALEKKKFLFLFIYHHIDNRCCSRSLKAKQAPEKLSSEEKKNIYKWNLWDIKQQQQQQREDECHRSTFLFCNVLFLFLNNSLASLRELTFYTPL